ncbi:MAG: alpha/beta fold hydrolase [Sterolibacteriaceae bacterium]|uniref:PHA/PHB synthase family protein n=1 Tax=Sulfuritalea sp. TaxID=2480090 RepID=UPI001A4B1C00|nr:alpha/beta fold hydrolase [Sulfuritalea sp.]MBL8478185.1 alpha/beta fold hydrolase [Sterolibacteriaceae bacterium]MBN8475589.1 alpha/beta fold hydrolase [Sulfuritalea sp.]
MSATKQTKVPATPQAAWRAVNQAVEAKVDPIGMATPLLHAQLAWLSHPQEMSETLTGFSAKMWDLQVHSWHRALGMPSKDVVSPNPDDTRFASPVWSESASWDIVKEWYLMLTHQVQDMLYDTPGLSSRDRRRAAFWWRKWLNAVAPTNFLLSNPEAMQRAMETRGESLLKGFNNLLTDFQAGDVQMARPTDFVVGRDLATTPGKVVFRNRLLEVIHYVPSREKVYRTPIVIVTPWINKFYILDLNAKKSMVKFLVDQGLDVYITSWKNPGADMREVSFDDYLIDGIGKLVETAQGLSGSDKVHAVGYCIGGAALSAWMAWANARYSKKDVPVASVTLLTTLVDYHKPGDIEVFLDENSIKWLEKSMAEKGYLDGKEMASAFRLLRSNSLVWHYVVRGYLFGEAPPPFDVLFWNMDATRMPAKMHSWYLRNFYLENLLIKKDALNLAGEDIDLGSISQPLYAVSAEDDHIAPWRQTFRINNFVAGSRRYVLSTSGHILGIVNPVVNPPKRDFHVGSAERHDTPDDWRERAELRHGSWWEDWMEWIKPQSGAMVPAPAVSDRNYPALADAPGTYVLEY